MDRAVARPRPGLHYLEPVPGEPAAVVAKPETLGNQGHAWRRLGVVGRPAVLRALRPQDAGRISIHPPRSLRLLAAADRNDRRSLRRPPCAGARRARHSADSASALTGSD